MINIFWWIRQILLILVGCGFLLFGVQILISAYSLKDPASFILTFFASNLIILISGVLVLGFINRIRLVLRNSKKHSQR
jgi:hypothetical protein